MDEARDLHGDVLGLLAIKPAESDAPSINAPDGVAWGSCLSVVYGLTRQLLLMDAKGIHYQSFDGISWSPWRPVAFTTPPQSFSLPTASGVTGASTYRKTQESLVIVDVDATKSSGFSTGETIGTLPEGSRPAKTAYGHASGQIDIELAVQPTGEVQVHQQSGSGSIDRPVAGQVLFFAAD